MTLEERIATDAALLAGLGLRCELTSTGGSEFGAWRLELSVSPERVNAAGYCHGGYLFALADTACAYALADAGQQPATIDANITYLKAARLNDLVEAQTEVLHIGRSQGVAEVRLVRVKDDQLLAVYRATCVNQSQN